MQTAKTRARKKRDKSVKNVISVWCVGGPKPEYTERARNEVRKHFPLLANAIEELLQNELDLSDTE